MHNEERPIIFERRKSQARAPIPNHIESDAELADRMLSVNAQNAHIALAAAIEVDLLTIRMRGKVA